MMRFDSKVARWPTIRSLAVGFFVGVAIAASSIWAQEGVAGATPVFSGPKKKPAQDPKIPPAASKIRVQSALVETPVTVLDSSGEFVYDLDENDFQVFDNGVPQRIQRFENEMRPLGAVILVQSNHLVGPLLDQVRPLASNLSELVLGAQGQAAVIFFDDRVRVVQDFTNDSDRLGATLRALAPYGDQARLNDALMRAVALLEKRPKEERRVIIAFSDGFDSGSETQKEEVVRRATTAEVAIYGLGFSPTKELLAQKPQTPPQNPLDTNVARPLPPGTVHTPTHSENVYGPIIPDVPILVAAGKIIRSARAESLLEVYAGYTGGVFYTHWSKKALQEQLSRVASEIHSQYEIAYVPDTLDQTGFHRIEIQVRRSGVKARARAGYFYPEKNP